MCGSTVISRQDLRFGKEELRLSRFPGCPGSIAYCHLDAKTGYLQAKNRDTACNSSESLGAEKGLIPDTRIMLPN